MNRSVHADDDGMSMALARRKSTRQSVCLRAVLDTRDACGTDIQPHASPESKDNAVPLRIRNLSQNGLMAECDRVLSPGTSVIVALEGVGAIRAHVAWCRNGRLGLAFDQEIDPKCAMRRIAQHAPASDTKAIAAYKRPGLRRF